MSSGGALVHMSAALYYINFCLIKSILSQNFPLDVKEYRVQNTRNQVAKIWRVSSPLTITEAHLESCQTVQMERVRENS